jgi:phosphatidylglycerol:prolipoprotein diacylglycerol transferase
VFPTLFDLGRHVIPWVGEVHFFLPTYGFLFAVAVLLAWWWFQRRARGMGLSDERVFNLIFYSLLAGILGAKLLLVLVDWPTYLAHPAEILGTLRSGGVLLGGIVLAALTFTLYARRHGLPLFALGDAVAAPMALAQAIGRLGCFSAGCCWGVAVPADHPLAVVFTNPLAHEQTGVPLNTPRLAIQPIEMVFDLLLCFLLTLLWRARLKPDGTVFWIYVLIYCLGRGVIEFWRGDAQRGLYFNGLLSTSQLLCGVGILFALAMLARGWILQWRRTNAHSS